MSILEQISLLKKRSKRADLLSTVINEWEAPVKIRLPVTAFALSLTVMDAVVQTLWTRLKLQTSLIDDKLYETKCCLLKTKQQAQTGLKTWNTVFSEH